MGDGGFGVVGVEGPVDLPPGLVEKRPPGTFSAPEEDATVSADAASLPAQAEPGKDSHGSVAHDQHDSGHADPQPLDDQYRAPIPGSTEEKVYRQYYLPFCAQVGVKPAPFLRWLALSEVVDKSRVETLDWGAPGRLRGKPAQPYWIPERAVGRIIQTNTASTAALIGENTASHRKEVTPEAHTADQRIGTFAVVPHFDGTRVHSV